MESQADNEVPNWVPVCDVCKKRDESLRVVSYPYVVSILVMTYQRAFSGIYCRKHQRWYHLLASLITSTVGWLGFPFGFIMTPITLFNLARGGVSNVEKDIQLLTAVAEKKLTEGDALGAVRCLEECLKLKDDPEIRSRLAKLYQIHRTSTQTHDTETLWQIIGVPGLLLISTLTGLLIGLLDLLLAYMFYPLFNENSSIFIAILSWLPTVVMIFLGILIVRATLRWTLNKNHRIPILLGSTLAVSSTFFAFYSVLEGQSIVRNLQGLFAFFSISPRDGIFAARSILSHGGVDVMINNFRQGDLPSVIFTVLLLAGFFLSVFVNMEMVRKVTNGNRLITQVRESLSMEMENPAIFAWGTFGFVILGFILMLAITFPGTYVNTEDVYQKINLGTTTIDQYPSNEAVRQFRMAAEAWPESVAVHGYLGLGYYYQEKYDQAMEEFDIATELDPDSTMAHLFKGYGYVATSKYDEAVIEYKKVVENQPTWGVPHADLAILYYLLGRTEEAEGEIQQAIAYENEDTQVISLIGSYYVYILDFEKAEEYFLRSIKLADDPLDYIYLSRVYTSRGEYLPAEKAIENAEKLGANAMDVYLAKINLAEMQNDLDTAARLVAEALKAYPERSDLHAERSFIEFRQNKIYQSAADAEKAIEFNPYNSHAYVELAYAYHAQGKLDQALTAAETAVSRLPTYDRAHYILGLCYMESNMKEEAIKEFEAFLKSYWDRPIIQDEKRNAEMYLRQLKQ